MHLKAISLFAIIFSLAGAAGADDSVSVKPAAGERPIVAAYYFANYHPSDPRNAISKGPGWSEWDLIKAAKPRFPGHDQPKVPMWGYVDESDPKVMAMKIDAAADNGLDAWIFDWYYYNDGPFLNRCLDLGYLKAPNRSRVKFCLMWANHDWVELHPATRKAKHQLLYPGVVTPENFDKICDLIIHDYFLQPNYLKIDGKPYFSFYDVTKLIGNFGTVEATRAALDRFRDKAKAAGLPGIHLNVVAWGKPVLPSEKTPTDLVKLIHDLGFDSATSYVWVHHVGLPTQQTDYNQARDNYLTYYDKAATLYGIPYFPNVSMGWDPSPRCRQSDVFDNSGYPFTNTMSNNTPERFREALEIVNKRVQAQKTGPRLITLNAWNEWTEGSYLEPDTVHGMKYLEAIRDVFGLRK